MPKRFCQCTGCSSCNVTTGAHSALFDLDLTGTLKCPGCQAVATTKRNARPSSSARGLGWAFTKRKQNDIAYQQAEVCHWCGRQFTKDNPKTADHTVPRSQGGNDSPIVAACRSCNSSRGGKLGKR